MKYIEGEKASDQSKIKFFSGNLRNPMQISSTSLLWNCNTRSLLLPCSKPPFLKSINENILSFLSGMKYNLEKLQT